MYIRRDVHTSPLFLCSVGGWGGNLYSPKKIWKRIPVAIGEGWCQRDDLSMWQIPGLLVDGWKMLEGWENEGLCHRYIGDPQVGFRFEKPCLRTCQCKYIFFFYIHTLGMAGTLPATVTIRILPSWVGDPYKFWLVIVTGKGPHLVYTFIYIYTKRQACLRLNSSVLNQKIQVWFMVRLQVLLNGTWV